MYIYWWELRKIIVVVIFIKINDNSVDHKGQFLKPIDIGTIQMTYNIGIPIWYL